MTLICEVSTIEKYNTEPRVATGRNCSRFSSMLTLVSIACSSAALTSFAFFFVLFNTPVRKIKKKIHNCRIIRSLCLHPHYQQQQQQQQHNGKKNHLPTNSVSSNKLPVPELKRSSSSASRTCNVLVFALHSAKTSWS